jgi:hypothetical protein
VRVGLLQLPTEAYGDAKWRCHLTTRVLFNGTVLVRPGASTKLDASQFQNISLTGIGIVGLIGEADGGEPRTVQAFNSSAGAKAFYQSGDLVEAAQMAADPSADQRVPTGAQTLVCYKVNGSTRSTLSHPTVTPAFIFTSKRYGVRANNATVAIAVGSTANERVITLRDLNEFGVEVLEVSPSLGGAGKFTIRYVGAGSAAAMTITATQLTTTVTGAAGDNLAITFADYSSLSDILYAIDNHPAYTAAALVANVAAFNPANLDAVAAVDIMTALTTVFARNFDLADWVTKNSAIVSVVKTAGLAGPVAVLVQTALTGGTRGTSANSDWIAGLLALRLIRINQLVPLASADATATQGTFTTDSILTALQAHCKFVSSTAGRNECQGWAGVAKTKANLIAAANLQNSEHIQLVGQKCVRQRSFDGELVTFPEWATAVILAGMRAGAPLGEPLTWKFANVLGLSSDASWSETNNDDVVDLTLNGVMVINALRGRGFRIDKAITTFTRFDNDAFTEETIVQIWKALSFDLRRALEDAFVGRGGDLRTVQSVPGKVTDVCEKFLDQKAITDSFIDGRLVKGYRNITVGLDRDQLAVGVTVSPVPGINFVLNTIVLIPARISL